MEKLRRPGGEISKRPLHFFFVCDVSGSMSYDGKIEALNNAIKEALPHMQSIAAENPNAKIYIRVLVFSEGARWLYPEAIPVENFVWKDLTAYGQTDMGEALRMIADELKIPPMTNRALPPVIVLISDGQPTDDFKGGLRALNSIPWGIKAVRIAIAIGKDADEYVLQDFIGDRELKPLRANNPEMLVRYIKWASTSVVSSVSDPDTETKRQRGNVPLPPVPDEIIDVDDVW